MDCFCPRGNAFVFIHFYFSSSCTDRHQFVACWLWKQRPTAVSDIHFLHRWPWFILLTVALPPCRKRSRTEQNAAETAKPIEVFRHFILKSLHLCCSKSCTWIWLEMQSLRSLLRPSSQNLYFNKIPRNVYASCLRRIGLNNGGWGLFVIVISYSVR